MAWLDDSHYEIDQQEDAVLLRRLESGVTQALAVRGRPGFDAEHAVPGLLYRVEWLNVIHADEARLLGAARFAPADAPRAAGNCLHLRAGRQTWCYRPREYDGGTLSLLPEAAPRQRRHALASLRGR
jgi:hypothetical protein